MVGLVSCLLVLLCNPYSMHVVSLPAIASGASSIATAVQQAAAAAQLLNTINTISSSLTGVAAPSLGSGPRSTATGSSGSGSGPIASGQVSSQQITSGMSTAFQFLQLVQPVSTLLTGSSTSLTSGLTNVLTNGIPSIGSGGLPSLGGGLPTGGPFSGGSGPLSGGGLTNPLTGVSNGGGPSLPNAPGSSGTDTSTVKYYTIAFAADADDAPSISSVDLYYRVQYRGQAGVNTIQQASMSRTSTTTFSYSKVAVDSSQGVATIIYTFKYTLTGGASQTTATFQYTPGDSAPQTIVPDGYTATGLGLVTDSITPYLSGIMAQTDGTYSLLWQSKYPSSFGANWVNAHYVINSGTQVDNIMQPMETNQEFAVNNLPVALGNTIAYSFTYEDAATSVATNTDWTTVTLRAAGSVPVNQSKVTQATASTRVLPGNLFTGDGPTIGTPPKIGALGGGGTSTDPPTTYVSGSCPARVEYTQSVVTDGIGGSGYAIQFTVKSSDIAITLVDVQYSVGSATTPVTAHMTASSSSLWVQRSIAIADTQTMTYYFTFGTSQWSCHTAVFTFAPAQADTSSGTGLPSLPGNGNGFPIDVPNTSPFPTPGSGLSDLPSPSDLLSSQDLQGCVSVSCYESCLTSSLLSTGMTACINNCVQDCALASQGQTAIVNSMRLIRLMRSMRMLSGQTATISPPAALSLRGRRLLQTDEPNDDSITTMNDTSSASSSSESTNTTTSSTSLDPSDEYGGSEYGGEPSSSGSSGGGSDGSEYSGTNSSSSSSSSTGIDSGGESVTPTVTYNCTSKETWNNTYCNGTWWSPDADPVDDDDADGGIKVAQLFSLLSDTTSVDGVPSLACTRCFESAVDAGVSQQTAMNGCAKKCVGTQIVTEGDTPIEALSSLMSVMDPTLLTALFTNAADNGILGMYELMTQLLMRGIGAMYWGSGGEMPERTGGVFNITGGPNGSGGLAGVIARNLTLPSLPNGPNVTLPDGPGAPSLPSTPNGTISDPSLPPRVNLTNIAPGAGARRRLLQDGASSLSELLAATNALITGTDDSTLTYDTTVNDDTDTTTDDDTDACSDDAITACSTACLPSDIGDASGTPVNLFKQRVCTENCMWPCLQSSVPFNFDTMRVMRLMSVTQQMRTAPPRQGGFNSDATTSTSTSSSDDTTSSDSPFGILSSLLSDSGSTATGILASLRETLGGTGLSLPKPGSGSGPSLPGSGTGNSGGNGPTLPGTTNTRNLTTVITPFGTVLAAMLPDAANFTMGPTSYDDDLNTILNRACQSCFISCLTNMTAVQRQACADTCTSECMDMSRPGSNRPFPTTPTASATATTATKDRKFGAAMDGLKTMASVMSLSTPSFASAMLDSGTRGMMDSVFSYTQSAASSLGTSQPVVGNVLNTLVDAADQGTSTLVTLFSGLSDTLGSGLSSFVSPTSTGKIAKLFTPSISTSLNLFGAMANGRAPRTAAISSTYDSFHQFLLRGLSDTMMFSGMVRGDNTSVFGADGSINPPTSFPNAGVNGYPTKQCSLCYYQCMTDYKHSLIGTCTRRQCQVCDVDTTSNTIPAESSGSAKTPTATRRLLTIVPPTPPAPIRPSIRLTPEQNPSPATPAATTATGNSRPNILPPVNDDSTIAAILANLNAAQTGGTSIPTAGADQAAPSLPFQPGTINSLDDAAAAFVAMTQQATNEQQQHDRGINTRRTPASRRQRHAAAAAAMDSPVIGNRPMTTSSATPLTTDIGSASSAAAASASSRGSFVDGTATGSSLRDPLPSSMSPSCALCHKQCLARSPGNVAKCSKTCVTLC